jgi:hypothetical protein
MAFMTGQKIVCVASLMKHATDSEIIPIVGEVYTIRAILNTDGLCFKLREIINAPQQYEEGFTECAFEAVAFRPVVERKTDISIFTAILKRESVNA